MLQISNLDDSKSEWNINETHIIIPMINGSLTNKESDKILTNTLTLSSLENADHSILSNALEHSFVIGFDKNLFDTPNYKSDLVIIQNSDLKLLSCNNDLKNPVAYTLSYVDQNKKETLWQGPISKDKTASNEKSILEVKDVLNYDDSVHELEKTELQVNLNHIDANTTSQSDNGIFTGESLGEAENGKKSNYFVRVSNGESSSVLQNLNASNSVEDVKLENNEKLFECKSQSGSNSYNDTGENTQNITEGVIKCDDLIHVEDTIKFKANEKHKSSLNKYKERRAKDITVGVSDSMPEKSLPLKKKAKMKRTLVPCNIENRRSLFKQDFVVDRQMNMKFPGRKTKNLLTVTSSQDKQNQHSIFNECFISKIRKQTNANIETKRKKAKILVSDSLIQEVKNESKNLANYSVQENGTTEVDELDGNKFKNIFDLVEYMRKCRLINTTVLETLNSGLKEIKIDILKEMNAKKNKKTLESFNYSPQLKAFALVLYFKQPAAFNYLSQVFKSGWPSLKAIKEWKRRINSYQRPNFVSIKVNPEGCKT